MDSTTKKINQELKGKRVELINTNDPYTDLQPGAKGTIAYVNSMGDLAIDWDSGSKLHLIQGVDNFRIINH